MNSPPQNSNVAKIFAAPRAIILAVALLVAAMMNLSAARAAAIIVYQFTPHATTTVEGTVLGIAGFFDYDVGLAALTAVNITVSNGASSETFNIITNSGVCFNSSTFICAEASSTDIIGISFVNPLGSGAEDPLDLPDAGCDCIDSSFNVIGSDSAVTGSAQPVPEPTSLALFGSAFLCSVVLRLWRHSTNQAVRTGPKAVVLPNVPIAAGQPAVFPP